MAEYLMPNFENISIEERRNIFEIRNRMVSIPINFPNRKDDTTCWCGAIEETRHIYDCKYWSDQSEQIEFNMIYTNDMPKLVKVFKQFKVRYKRREEFKNNIENGKEQTPT